MILVLGGTREAREVVNRLSKEGRKLILSVATRYGAKSLGSLPGITINSEPLDTRSLAKLVRDSGVGLILDCTHPFAVEISKAAIEVCRSLPVRYIRLEREKITDNGYPGLVRVPDFRQAARLVAGMQGPVMLTFGVNHLQEFLAAMPGPGPRLVVRVLPSPDSISRCLQVGIDACDIIAMHGPGSTAFNEAIFKEYQVKAVVAKDSGTTGGTRSKLEAAERAGLTFILVERPHLEYPEVVGTVEELVEVGRLSPR